jgi:hypothetical protein
MLPPGETTVPPTVGAVPVLVAITVNDVGTPTVPGPLGITSSPTSGAGESAAETMTDRDAVSFAWEMSHGWETVAQSNAGDATPGRGLNGTLIVSNDAPGATTAFVLQR